ncbi:MAG: 2-C-methyl-D-erythritol 4-phosphate cytidylyltransferase [Phycisphaerae bacterium]
MSKVSVIIPAAGSGTRFGADENKILLPLGGRPMFLRTLEAFAARADVVQMLLVVAPGDRAAVAERFGETLDAMSVTVVEGGPTRAHSVKNALAAVTAEADLVAVHDAARPCVSQGRIDAVFARAARTGAAILACPVHGTLKRVADGETIEQTVCRESLWQAHTPQVFEAALLRQAYAQPLENVTDDAMLVERLGRTVSVVPDDPRNLKVTTPADLQLAAAVIDTL